MLIRQRFAAALLLATIIAMDETPVTHPSVPEEVYHKLGGKTLMIFVLQRIQASLVLLVVSIVLLILQSQPFLAQVPVPNFTQYVGFAGWACLILFAIFFLLSFLIAWLIYINFKFCLGEN